MKLLTKLKQAVGEEVSRYNEAKKRKLILRFMIAFAVLIIMNLFVSYLKMFYSEETAIKQKNQAAKEFELPIEKQVSHQQMIENLNQMKNDIQKQRKNHEIKF